MCGRVELLQSHSLLILLLVNCVSKPLGISFFSPSVPPPIWDWASEGCGLGVQGPAETFLSILHPVAHITASAPHLMAVANARAAAVNGAGGPATRPFCSIITVLQRLLTAVVA